MSQVFGGRRSGKDRLGRFLRRLWGTFQEPVVVHLDEEGNRLLWCDVCGDEAARGVAAVPGVPVSVAYGPRCLRANAHPMWVLVGNTASICAKASRWREESASWWQAMVDDTLKHLGVTEKDFVRQVARSIRMERRYFRTERVRHWFRRWS